MKKIASLIALLVLVPVGLQAQIKFETGTFAAAMEKAKKEKKPIFVDVYASWCGPCKRMAATAFMDKKVGEFYNQNYISIQIDAEKASDGPATAAQFGVDAYPTLLYFSPEGTLVKKVVGSMDAEQLLTRGEEVLHPEKTPGFAASKKFHSSKKSRTDLKDYLAVLLDTDSDSLEQYTELYYKQYADLNLDDPVEFEVFFMQEGDPHKPLSREFMEHPEKFDDGIYPAKLEMFVQQSFTKAVEQKDFSIVENAVRLVFPYLAKAIDGIPEVESYLQYVRTEYDKL